MAVTVSSSICALPEAPEDVGTLLSHWQGLRGARKYPARRDIDPVELRAYLGFLCILEIQDEPADFIFRLFGSGIAEFLHRDLTGHSIRDMPSEKLGRCLFEQMEDTIQHGAPGLYRVEVSRDSPPLTSASYRLILPLSDDGETIDGILTYSRFDTLPLDFWG